MRRGNAELARRGIGNCVRGLFADEEAIGPSSAILKLN